MEFKADTTLKERPKCAVEGCNNKAFLLAGGKFICGECYVKFKNKATALVFEQINDANKKEGETKSQ